MKRTLAAAAIAALTLPACSGLARAAYATPDEIQRSLTAYVGHTPGIVVIAGVIDNGKTRIYTAGSPPPGAPALSEDTIFQVGSITKTFTATLLAEMARKGQIRLDAPVSTCLPAATHMPSYQSKPITFLNLAEQNSGFPKLPSNLGAASAVNPYASYSETDLNHFLSSFTLTREPGSKYAYSNLGFSLLGIALAHCAHTSFPSLLNETVLAPLGMRNSGFDAGASRARFMPGFFANLKPATPWTGEFLAPAGGLNSTMRDMLRYLQANIDAPAGALGNAMADAQTPRAATNGPSFVKIGLAWYINTFNGNVWHDGETGGYTSIIILNRAERSGVVVLTNVADPNSESLGLHIIAPSLIQAPTFVATSVSQAHATGTSSYAGVYRLTPTFAITISGDGNALHAQATGQQALTLTPISGTTYAVEGVDAQITFVRDHGGKVTALVLHQNGMDQTGQRQP